jgi:hypothetical protein
VISSQSGSTYDQRARSIGHDFQRALDDVFFKDNGTRIPELTHKYGVF